MRREARPGSDLAQAEMHVQGDGGKSHYSLTDAALAVLVSKRGETQRGSSGRPYNHIVRN
jgi:hypothetical protein